MTENETKNWEEARARLVEQRQSTVKALAKGRQIKNDIDLLIKSRPELMLSIKRSMKFSDYPSTLSDVGENCAICLCI